MPRKTKVPTSGRLFTLGREPIGQFIGQITAFERMIGYSRHHFASFSDSKCDGVKGGARFTASACRIVIGMIKENISTGGAGLPVQWPTLSSEYEAAKEKYVGGLGQWRLTDKILNSIGIQKRWGEAGRSVGIYGNEYVNKIGFAAMRGGSPSGKIRPSTYAFWNEFGTNPTKYSGGQPPRPVFIPTYQQFAHKYLPGQVAAICESLEEDFKRLAKNIGKLGGKFVGEKLPPGEFREDVVLGATYFETAEGGDAYQKKLKKDMASSGANKWLAEHAGEMGEFED
jgi:hypothetical protein